MIRRFLGKAIGQAAFDGDGIIKPAGNKRFLRFFNQLGPRFNADNRISEARHDGCGISCRPANDQNTVMLLDIKGLNDP
ncbi:MAG: Uncharacterised protein [SAR116 cluster bacterium]|nr:MAG: Uncharacterised protein [SAR116 cluster bacterium]